MYQTSDDVAAAILGYSRTWRIRLEEIGGDIVIGGDEITQANSEHTSSSLSDDIELGAVCAQHWTVRTSHNGEFVGKRFLLYFYMLDLNGADTVWGDLEAYTIAELSEKRVEDIENIRRIIGGEFIPMGELVCVKAPRTDDGRELQLYDQLYFSDRPYTPGIPLPAAASAVEQDICEQLGVICAASYGAQGYLYGTGAGRPQLVRAANGVLYTASFDFTVDSVENGTTMRQMLGYIAGASGQFGCIDRQGRYVRRWYGEPVTTIDHNHADEPTLSEVANRIVGIRCTGDDEDMTAGQQSGGRVLEIDNPYMTQPLLNALYQRIRDMSWYTAQVYERLGDPRHDIGDTVTLGTSGGNYDIPITNLSYTFDGGLAADIEAVGLTDEEQNI